MEGAELLCRIGSSLKTCHKHNISQTAARDFLFLRKPGHFYSHLTTSAETFQMRRQYDTGLNCLRVTSEGMETRSFQRVVDREAAQLHRLCK